MKQQTPWGVADRSIRVADGITIHHTPSHGGMELSPAREAQFRAKFPSFRTFVGGGNRWFEEDCDACAVVIAFPEAFPDADLVGASDMARWCVDMHTNQNEDKLAGWKQVHQHADRLTASLRRTVPDRAFEDRYTDASGVAYSDADSGL